MFGEENLSDDFDTRIVDLKPPGVFKGDRPPEFCEGFFSLSCFCQGEQARAGLNVVAGAQGKCGWPETNTVSD